MTGFDKDGFLNWLERQDGAYVDDELVREEWPAFYDHYSLTGCTFLLGDDGESLVPKRDYRDAVVYGYVRD